MAKFITAFLFLFVFSSCNSTDSQREATEENAMIDNQPIPEAVAILPEARVILDQWPQFQSLENRMATLKEVESSEELKLILEELSQICQQVEENEFPELFETPSIRSRIRVLRTYLGKLDASLYYRTDSQEPLLELQAAYNALRSQFNVIISNTLTPELFNDE
ncbi:MAG: hypothetical protein P8X60_01835 [Robiginitalea sp.]|jgi:hypothetical protein